MIVTDRRVVSALVTIEASGADVLQMRLSDTSLSLRVLNVLGRSKIQTLGDLISYHRWDLPGTHALTDLSKLLGVGYQTHIELQVWLTGIADALCLVRSGTVVLRLIEELDSDVSGTGQ
jgi:hypothetical protein